MKLQVAFHGCMNVSKNVTIITKWLWNWQCKSFNVYTLPFNATMENDTTVQILINPVNPQLPVYNHLHLYWNHRLEALTSTPKLLSEYSLRLVLCKPVSLCTEIIHNHYTTTVMYGTLAHTHPEPKTIIISCRVSEWMTGEWTFWKTHHNCLCEGQLNAFLSEGCLTLILLTWSIGWAPNNASKWQMGFNSAFKGLMWYTELKQRLFFVCNVHLIQDFDMV
jgi:hypothetical protein